MSSPSGILAWRSHPIDELEGPFMQAALLNRDHAARFSQQRSYRPQSHSLRSTVTEKPVMPKFDAKKGKQPQSATVPQWLAAQNEKLPQIFVHFSPFPNFRSRFWKNIEKTRFFRPHKVPSPRKPKNNLGNHKPKKAIHKNDHPKKKTKKLAYC